MFKNIVLPVFVSVAILAASSIPALAEGGLPLVNPGFESGLDGWTVKTSDKNAASGTVTKEAAKEGESGLRIVDDKDDKDVMVSHDKHLPVKPGKTYQLTYQARAPKNNKGVCVFIRFIDAEGTPLLLEGGHRILSEIDADSPEWKEYTLEGVAPETAVEMDFYVRTNKRGIVLADLDSFQITEK